MRDSPLNNSSEPLLLMYEKNYFSLRSSGPARCAPDPQQPSCNWG